MSEAVLQTVSIISGIFFVRDPEQGAAHRDAIAPLATAENGRRNGADAFFPLLIAVHVSVFLDCLQRPPQQGKRPDRAAGKSHGYQQPEDRLLIAGRRKSEQRFGAGGGGPRQHLAAAVHHLHAVAALEPQQRNAFVADALIERHGLAEFRG